MKPGPYAAYLDVALKGGKQEPFPELDHGSWQGALTRAKYLLVHVGLMRESMVERKVAEYCTNEFRNQFAFGYMRPSAIGVATWWTKHFGTSNPRAGYYLFSGGRLVGSCADIVPDPKQPLLATIAQGLLDLTQKPDRIIRQVESLVNGPPTNESSAAEDDPFAILGVKSGAPLADCEQAFRDAVKETHPDRLQEILNARMAQLNGAMQQIRAKYGKR